MPHINTKKDLEQGLMESQQNNIYLQETIYELEQELLGWQVLSSENNLEFSRSGLATIARQSLVYWLRNPLIHRAPLIVANYVFGQGINVGASNNEVTKVVNGFWKNRKNRETFTATNSLIRKECELEIDGNVFLALFINKDSGSVQVRSIPFAEITNIVTNPEDSSDVWFYKRNWTTTQLKAGEDYSASKSNEAYYADYRLYGKLDKVPLPAKFNKSCYIYHVKTNCISNMHYGVSELYAGVAWAKAYKEFLENWSAIAKALARFAWRAQFPGGAKAVDAAKAKLTAKDSTGTYSANKAAATAVSSKDVVFEAINKSGALPDSEGGRRLLLMVSAATGIYEHYFGDPSTGNLATSKSMERPMELMFRARQSLWQDVILDILNFVIARDIEAPNGIIKGVKRNGDEYILPIDSETGEPLDITCFADFPEILEHDQANRIAAIVSGATLNGSPQAGTIPDPQYLTELILRALGERDATKIAAELHQEETDDNVPVPASEQAMTEALRELKESLKSIFKRTA